MFDSSVWIGLFNDAKSSLLTIRYVRPWAFGLALIPLLLLTLEVIAIRRAWERFRSLGTLSTLLLMRTSHRERGWLTIMLTLLAWNSLVIGLVGPCWGEGEPDGVLQGRDLVIVLDMSRSMLASDAAVGTRFETAQSAALELVESLRTRGGHRVGVIIFAAKPMVWVPLTADYDHVSKKLLELDAAHVPLGIRPSEDSKSGTRFGAALLLAIKQHDERYQGSQDVLLLSDGDDPANDREWALGVTPARRARIPVHSVGFGDPDPERAVTIILDGQLLESPDAMGIPQPVRTSLNESVLKSVAEEGDGLYYPVRREQPRLGEFFRQSVVSKATREVLDDTLTQKQNRSHWFFLLALSCWLAIWWRTC